MAAAAILDFRNLNFFNGRNGQEGQTASLCQISSKSLELRPRYGAFSIFQDDGRRHLEFQKFQIFNGQKVELHQCTKFHRNRSNCRRDMVFLDFSRWRPPPSWVLEIA